MKFVCYLDLDGVLCNWEKAYTELSGKPLKEPGDVDWKLIEKAGVQFWSDMEWMPDGKQLWKALKEFKPTILSSPSRHDGSRVGKRIWVRRELGKSVPLILDTDKYKYAKEGALLIDDTKKQIDKFKAHGGMGILHTSTEDTLSQIARLAI